MVLVKTMTNPICETNGLGTKHWYNDKGELHRENDLPAVEYAGGTKCWYLNGKRHRENGPAVESANGSKFWWLNNKRHRETGPAVEYADGRCEWWVDGELVDCTDNETFLRMMKYKWAW
jgi:hypothetical protein